MPLPPSYVEVGPHSYFGPDVQFHRWIPEERIRIGGYCSISAGVVICVGGNHDTNAVSTYPFDNFFRGLQNPTRTYRRTRDTEIGCDVWIGMRALVGGGVRIGNGAVIGSSAVVLSDIPDYAIAAGNPARVVRYRFSKEIVERLLRIAWWQWPEEKVRANLEWFYRPVLDFVNEFDSPEASRDE